MSNKKQTAVEWFFSELQRMQYFIGNDMLQAYKDAKEMDKQQKIEDYRAGRTDQQSDKLGKSYNRRAADYYKETYEDNN